MAQASAAAKTAGGAAPARGAAPSGMPGMPGQNDPSTKNAKQFVALLVKHEYLNGFKLPDMPA
jgi:hypothetical protein